MIPKEFEAWLHTLRANLDALCSQRTRYEHGMRVRNGRRDVTDQAIVSLDKEIASIKAFICQKTAEQEAEHERMKNPRQPC